MHTAHVLTNTVTFGPSPFEVSSCEFLVPTKPATCILGAMAKAMKAMKAMKTAKAMTAGGIVGAIASETELKPAAVRNVLHSLQGLAKQEVAKTGKFVIPQTVMLKLKHKPAKPAGKRMMFGKEVVVKAKKASKIVKAFPAAALKKAI